MSDTEWVPGGLTFPERVELRELEQGKINELLWNIGIEEDIFAMDRFTRIKKLSESRYLAAAVYSAIVVATEGRYEITQTFHEWASRMGLPW